MAKTMKLRITLQELADLKPCHTRYELSLKTTFPRNKYYTVKHAFEAGISQRDILWVLYKLYDEKVNTLLNVWLEECVRKAREYAAAFAAYAAYASAAYASADAEKERARQKQHLISLFT